MGCFFTGAVFFLQDDHIHSYYELIAQRMSNVEPATGKDSPHGPENTVRFLISDDIRGLET